MQKPGPMIPINQKTLLIACLAGTFPIGGDALANMAADATPGARPVGLFATAIVLVIAMINLFKNGKW